MCATCQTWYQEIRNLFNHGNMRIEITNTISKFFYSVCMLCLNPSSPCTFSFDFRVLLLPPLGVYVLFKWPQGQFWKLMCCQNHLVFLKGWSEGVTFNFVTDKDVYKVFLERWFFSKVIISICKNKFHHSCKRMSVWCFHKSYIFKTKWASTDMTINISGSWWFEIDFCYFGLLH